MLRNAVGVNAHVEKYADSHRSSGFKKNNAHKQPANGYLSGEEETERERCEGEGSFVWRMELTFAFQRHKLLFPTPECRSLTFVCVLVESCYAPKCKRGVENLSFPADFLIAVLAAPIDRTTCVRVSFILDWM